MGNKIMEGLIKLINPTVEVICKPMSELGRYLYRSHLNYSECSLDGVPFKFKVIEARVTEIETETGPVAVFELQGIGDENGN